MNRLSYGLLFAALLSGCQVQSGADAGLAQDTTSAQLEAPRPGPEPRRVAPIPDSTELIAIADTVAPEPAPEPVLEPAEIERRRVAALSALEDLGVRAEGNDAIATSRALALADERLAALPLATRPAALDSLRRAARRADTRGDGSALALAAAQAHRTLSTGRSEEARIHSEALVLSALTRSALPNWRAIRSASERLATLWRTAAHKVEVDGVHDAVEAAVVGIQAGAQTQNAPVVRLASDIVADLVGELPPAAPDAEKR